MVFDVKMDNLTQKARFVAGGHTTDTPSSITYSSVVSRDSVRIAFLFAFLNNCDVCVADIGNAYLNAECREKIWTIAGPEFGSDDEKGTLWTEKFRGRLARPFCSNSIRDRLCQHKCQPRRLDKVSH
jgi:hypothetical protein